MRTASMVRINGTHKKDMTMRLAYRLATLTALLAITSPAAAQQIPEGSVPKATVVDDSAVPAEEAAAAAAESSAEYAKTATLTSPLFPGLELPLDRVFA